MSRNGRSVNMEYLVSASVLSADMLRLGEEIEKIEKNGIDSLHFDVMDGVLVNNISFGLPVLEAVRRKTSMPLDVHLMITDPLRYVKRFAEAGADIISFHIESESDASATIRTIRESGAKAAIALSPKTPAEMIYKYLPDVCTVLVMTVEPGFGGQSFIPGTVDKIRSIRERITGLGLDVHIEVDGGINDETASVVRNAGADILVSGSYLFKAEDMKKAAELLRAGI